MILELAYYNNPRHPISLKELRGRLKEFVNVDFFSSALKVKRVSSGTSRGINRGWGLSCLGDETKYCSCKQEKRVKRAT